eukprot:scaffold202748_cov45-Prasinocladus_malaysianus.AAC.1
MKPEKDKFLPVHQRKKKPSVPQPISLTETNRKVVWRVWHLLPRLYCVKGHREDGPCDPRPHRPNGQLCACTPGPGRVVALQALYYGGTKAHHAAKHKPIPDRSSS